MSTPFLILLIWAIISIPFAAFAYAIFLIRENKQTKFAAIYKLAVIFFAVFLIIMAGYVLTPVMYMRAGRPSEVVLEGRYRDTITGDTLVIIDGQFSVRNAAKPEHNISGSYTINYPHGSGFFSDLKYLYSNSSAGNYNRAIQISYIDSGEYRSAIRKNAKTPKKNTYVPVPYLRNEQLWIVPEGTDISLINSRTLYTRKMLRKL